MDTPKQNPAYRILTFPHFADPRGTLTPFEFDDQFPFPVKRVYLVTGNDGETRGDHAHLQEEEIFVAASGTITARVHDGEKEAIILLDHPSKALYVNKLCWHEFYDFSPGAVMLCFSSTHYLPGEQNYIYDEQEFLKMKF